MINITKTIVFIDSLTLFLIKKGYFSFFRVRALLSVVQTRPCAALYDMYAKGEFTMAVYFADAVERFVEDMLEANADNLKAFETKPGVYSNVDPETHHEVEIPDVHLSK